MQDKFFRPESGVNTASLIQRDGESSVFVWKTIPLIVLGLPDAVGNYFRSRHIGREAIWSSMMLKHAFTVFNFNVSQSTVHNTVLQAVLTSPSSQ